MRVSFRAPDLLRLFIVAAILTVDTRAAEPKSESATVKQADLPTEAGKVDWERAKRLHARAQAGEKLSTDDQAYYDRARELRGRRGGDSAAVRPTKRPDPNNPIVPRDSVGLVPLTELLGEYKGESGGLYGAGRNTPPEAHRAAAEAQLAKIEPLDAEGKPAQDGTVVFISISMSNATMEFSHFKRLADADERKSSKVVIVDCAQGGQAMAEWVNPQAQAWQRTDQRLASADVSPQQVQVVWIKLANKLPSGELWEHGEKLQRDTLKVVQNAKARFPNLRIAYLGSRTYGGYASGGLNPEPYAYESAYAARWLIQDQIAGAKELNYDPAKGDVKAPLLLWGPYFWADGVKPRADGLTWQRSDFAGDGVHPSESGRQKVAEMLLRFFHDDPLAKPWYVQR